MSACATHRQVIHENLPLRDPTMAEINRRKRLRESDDVFSEYSKPSKRRLTELIEKEIAALRISYSHPKKYAFAFLTCNPETYLLSQNSVSNFIKFSGAYRYYH